jgi:hypothetical protein
MEAFIDTMKVKMILYVNRILDKSQDKWDVMNHVRTKRS